MDKQFKKSLFGFRKKDVVAYLEKLGAEKRQLAQEGAAKSEELEKQLEELREKAEGGQGELDKSREELDGCREKISELVGQLKETESLLAARKNELEAKDALIAQKNEELDAKEAALAKCTGALEYEDGRVKSLSAKLEQAESRVQALQGELAGARREMDEAQRRFIEQRAGDQRIDELKRRIADVESSVSARAKEAAMDAERRVRELLAAGSAESQLASGQLSRNDEIFRALREKLGDIVCDLTELVGALAEAEARSAKREAAQQTGKLTSLRDILDRVKSIGDQL